MLSHNIASQKVGVVKRKNGEQPYETRSELCRMAGVYVHRQREVSQSLPLMVSSLSLYDQRDMRTAGKVRSETLAKLNLGRAWQEQAGPVYRCFLVFQDKDISMTGAYPMSEFLKILDEL